MMDWAIGAYQDSRASLADEPERPGAAIHEVKGVLIGPPWAELRCGASHQRTAPGC